MLLLLVAAGPPVPAAAAVLVLVVVVAVVAVVVVAAAVVVVVAGGGKLLSSSLARSPLRSRGRRIYDMVVDLKVHVEIVHWKGRQGSNMRLRDSSFFRVRESFFFAKVATYFNMRPLWKISVRFAKDSRKYFCIREEWPFADKGI